MAIRRVDTALHGVEVPPPSAHRWLAGAHRAKTLGKYVSRRSVKAKRPAVKGVEPIVPH